jgi:elongation factor 3
MLLKDYCSDHEVLKTLHSFATNKKSGFERESAAIAFQSLANIIGAPIAPIFLPSLPVLFELYMDKGEVVRSAAAAAVKSILKLFPPESTRIAFKHLESILETGKWRTKVGVLDAFRSFVVPAKDAVAAELGDLLPKVEHAMHDTKQEVSLLRSFASVSLTFTLKIGLFRRNKVCHVPVHDSCQSRRCTPHPGPCEMHGQL